MELTHEFSVKVPVDEAWTVLTDLERVAPCMPGFELQEVDGEEYRGVVKVKVGPMVARYKGVASFQERDETGHRAVVRAEGRETRGQGNAAATVTATLEPGEGGTRITLHTDLTITGKVAQFGRGVLADVSNKLLRQFVEALEADVLEGPATAGAAIGGAHAAGASAVAATPEAVPDGSGSEDRNRETDPPAPRSEPRPVASRSSEPVDLLAVAGSSVMRRIAPLALLAALALWLLLRG